eukprot:883565_1
MTFSLSQLKLALISSTGFIFVMCHTRNLLHFLYYSLCSRKRWNIEVKIFYYKLHIIILAIITQLIHSAAANYAYFRHKQSEPLMDIGFEIIGPLPSSMHYISELITFIILVSAFIISFITFFMHPTPVYWATFIIRVLFQLTLCTPVRIILFLSTSLPGPAP